MELSPESLKQEFDSTKYVDTIRQAYQEEAIHYTGRRNDEQQAIRELLEDESDAFIDTGALLLLNPNDLAPGADVAGYLGVKMGSEYEEKYREMKDAFRQLYVAMAIASLRMERDGITTSDGHSVKSLIDLPDNDRISVLNKLFADFQELNALRFGAVGSGLKRKVYTGELDADDKETYYEIDKDVILNPTRLWQSMQIKKYREYATSDESQIPAISLAGKMSPAQYVTLRMMYWDLDKEDFDKITGSNQNAKKALDRRYSR